VRPSDSSRSDSTLGGREHIAMILLVLGLIVLLVGAFGLVAFVAKAVENVPPPHPPKRF
jgi:flagellar basal body-associated protein FliL